MGKMMVEISFKLLWWKSGVLGDFLWGFCAQEYFQVVSW